VNAVRKKNGESLAHRACTKDQAECLAVLIRAGAKIDMLTDEGEPPIDIARKARIADRTCERCACARSDGVSRVRCVVVQKRDSHICALLAVPPQGHGPASSHRPTYPHCHHFALSTERSSPLWRQLALNCHLEWQHDPKELQEVSTSDRTSPSLVPPLF
jgi:hypothetical protein